MAGDELLRVTLPGQVRSPKNHRAWLMVGRRMRQVPSDAYRAWEREAFRALSRAVEGRPEFPYEGPVWVQAVAYVRGQAPDLVAVLEAVGDVLQGEWLVSRGRKVRPLWAVILDDRQIQSWDGSRVIRVRTPSLVRTEVVVYRYRLSQIEEPQKVQIVGKDA